MKSRAPVPGLMSCCVLHSFPTFYSLSNEYSRIYFKILDLCVSAGLPLIDVTTDSLWPLPFSPSNL
jgi:hypothetical protein